MKRISRQVCILLMMLMAAFSFQGIDNLASHGAEADQPLQDGYYVISTALDNSKVLDVDAAKTTDGANVQLWENANVGQQRFKVTSLGNGSYKITAYHSDKSLDVKYSDKKSGTNLQQYQWNNTAAQQWIIKSAGDGYYYIQSKLGTYVDCAYAKATNGTNVQLYEFNGSKAQKWKFTKYDNAMFISGNVASINCRPVVNKVRVKASGACKMQANVNWITAASYDNTYVSFKTDENFGGAREGKIKVICGDTSQMIYVKQRAYEPPVANGMYKIFTALNSAQVLDIDSAKTSNAANVQLWRDSNVNQQKFNLTYLGDGYYKIINENSGKSLDVSGANGAEKVNLQQYDYNGTSAQKWRLKYVDGSNYYIQSALGTYIDSKDAQCHNGNNVWMYKFNGTKAQQWRFEGTSRTAVTEPNPVKSRLDLIANGNLSVDKYTTMRVGSKFAGTRATEQCKGYAKNVFSICFNVTPSKTKDQPNNHLLNSNNGMKCIASDNNLNSSTKAKALFNSARSGDFVQMRRGHGGSHSAIVYEVGRDSVTFLEANTDNRNTVRKQSYTWSKLDSDNAKMSVYTANDYRLK